MNETKNARESINIRIEQAEDRNSELQDRNSETTQSQENKEKKNEKEWGTKTAKPH